MAEGDKTATIDHQPPSDRLDVRGFTLDVIDGAPPATLRSRGARVTIGSHESNELVVDHATVSRFHCELVSHPTTVRVRDLGSRNGTVLDGVRVLEAEPRDGSVLRLGRATVRFSFADATPMPLSPRRELGGLVGESPALRATFAMLERAAASAATILLEGETGTGKGALAEAVHAESARREQPFVVVDCGAMSATLLDSELFGHEKGAFTGADARRIGAFEEADGGTVFLDEIGEMPSEMQVKLLRVLENREVRRVGQNARRAIDVRVIAATNRDLRAEVNAGRFRADLYYRLAVVVVTVPPLRERREDIPVLARAILQRLRARPDEIAALTAPDVISRLASNAWPGNVRELRNHLERMLVLQLPGPAIAGSDIAAASEVADAVDGADATEVAEREVADAADVTGPVSPEPAQIAVGDGTYAEERRKALDVFERCYADAMLRTHDGKVAPAAKAAGLARYSFYRLLRRHGLKPAG